jgi:tetratricopeptide (TPR) repeat protein
MVGSVGAAAGLGYLIYVSKRGAGAERAVRELLAEADYELSLGYRARGLERLSAAAQITRSERSLLGVLKRTRLIAAATGDFAPLARLSQVALDRKPTSRRIGEIYVYAAIRADTGGKAGLWLSRLSGRRESEAIVVEAYLRGRSKELAAQTLSGEMSSLLGLSEERDPVRLEAAAKGYGDARLWLDAALGWMKAADAQRAERAWEAVGRAADLPASREPAIYIAYDCGKYEEALAALQSEARVVVRPDRMILAADLSLLLGRVREAGAGYLSAVEAWPDYSWVPYLNLASLEEQAGDGEGAERRRARAQALFPGVEAVALRYTADLQGRGDIEGARAAIVRFLQGAPDSLAANLRLLDLKGAAASPAVYTAALWGLLRRHPDDGRLCRVLVLYLLELRDFDGAGMALAEFERASSGGGRAWLEEYRSVLAAAQGDYAGATAAMLRSIDLEPTWKRHYNLGVLHGAAGRAQGAIEELRQAEELLLRGGGLRAGEGAGGESATGSAGHSVQRSRIRALIGEQLLTLADLQGARRECEYALDLDPLNHRARLVLNILEGR